MSQSVFSRNSGQFAAPPVPSRRDNFRLRKPNTSRPPSMHVDDYVARERNVDGTTSNVIAVPRLGSSSGRLPSIHVDEFMARERERQNPVGMAGSPQVKNTPPENDLDAEKMNKSKQLRPHLDDDLQELTIDLGDEESGSDDGLPFPQPDDNLQQPPSITGDHNSPHSIVEETESDSRMGTPLKSNFDDNNNNNNNNQSDFSSRLSVSRPEVSLTREPSISSEKKYFDMSAEARNGQMNSAKVERSVGFSSLANIKNPKSSSHALHPNTSHGQAKELYDQKYPPLPPMPPPSSNSPMHSRNHDSIQSGAFQNSTREPQYPPGFHVHSEYGRNPHLSSGGSVRPAPPLPPTPPPSSSLRTSTPPSSAYNHPNIGSTELMQSFAPSNMSNLSGYPQPMMQQIIYNRPTTPYNFYANSPNPNQGENQSNLSQSFPMGLQPITQLQPLQPPQHPRLPHPPPPHLRPPGPALTPSEQAMSGPVHMQVQQLQMIQPSLASPAHVYYQTMQQDNFPHAQHQQQQRLDPQLQVQQQGQSSNSLQQDASSMSLQDIFSSHDGIQNLLHDREKLVQLLEQNPKLMDMLQEKLRG